MGFSSLFSTFGASVIGSSAISFAGDDYASLLWSFDAFGSTLTDFSSFNSSCTVSYAGYSSIPFSSSLF